MDLGKQVGPLPLGAWVAVVAGGLGIAVWSRNKSSGPPVEVVDTGGQAGVGEGAATPGWIQTKPPSETDQPIGYDTNEAWGRAAINWLIAQGYPPGLASSAITKALAGGEDISGNKMSVQEWSLWTLALTKFGSPPQPVNVAPPTSTPGPVTPTPDPPPVTPPAPKPNPNPTPQPGGQGRYEEWRISRQYPTLSHLVAASNRKHGTNYTWQQVWEYNLKWRSPVTVALLKLRGPNFTYTNSMFEIPY